MAGISVADYPLGRLKKKKKKKKRVTSLRPGFLIEQPHAKIRKTKTK